VTAPSPSAEFDSPVRLTGQATACQHPELRVSSSTECLLADHEPMLRAVAKHLCRRSWDTEDLVQETFERALRYLSAGRPAPTNMRSWLATILRNAFISRIRRRLPPFEPIDDLAAPEIDPPQPWVSVSIEDVRVALRRLNDKLRLPFEMHYLEGLRCREVAARLGVPENTVASRLSRAREALREELARAVNEEPS
jgi:RNA polymerase sigma-70 factor, ECF subfamily